MSFEKLAGDNHITTNATDYSIDASGAGKEISFKTNGTRE